MRHRRPRKKGSTANAPQTTSVSVNKGWQALVAPLDERWPKTVNGNGNNSAETNDDDFQIWDARPHSMSFVRGLQDIALDDGHICGVHKATQTLLLEGLFPCLEDRPQFGHFTLRAPQGWAIGLMFLLTRVRSHAVTLLLLDFGFRWCQLSCHARFLPAAFLFIASRHRVTFGVASGASFTSHLTTTLPSAATRL